MIEKRVSPLRDATLKPSKDEYTTDAFKMTVYPEGLTSLDDRKKSFEAAGGARSKGKYMFFFIIFIYL